MQHNRIKNPNWQEATSWLFTSLAEDWTRDDRAQIQQVARGPFLESPGTFTGPKSNIQIEK